MARLAPRLTSLTPLSFGALAAAAMLVLACRGGAETRSTDERAQISAGAHYEGPSGEPDQPVSLAATGFTTFPAVSINGLSGAQQRAFAKMANEEICPCDCPKSWAACLQEGTKCGPAVLLAEWAVGQLADGLDPEILSEQITNEIAGFSARPKKLDLRGFATKGAKQPDFTVVEYADFECAHCKAATSVVRELVRRHSSKVQVVYKHFPLSFHPNARTAAAAAEAAGKQGRFWEMHDAIFATQTMLDEDLIDGHAKALGLDVARFRADWKSKEILERVDRSRKEGEAIGVESTPSFFVNGRPFNLMRTLDAFELRFSMERARKTATCH